MLLFTFSCAPALKQNEIDSWLISISLNHSPSLDISGKWHDPNGNFMFGWGEGYLQQKQNKVNGQIGNYNVKGIVSGKQVYLAFISGGDVYYTARLEMLEHCLLSGNYFYSNDKTQSNGFPTSLAKTDCTTTKSARLYSSDGKVITANFEDDGSGGGRVYGEFPNGEIFKGEYSTISNRSEIESMFTTPWGPLTGISISEVGPLVSFITAVGDKGTQIQCMSLPRESHGYGACRDSNGTEYKLSY